jgi:hypothetical protein
MSLEQYSNIELLAELLEREGPPHQAPEKTVRYGVHYEVLVGIGKDNTANITLTDDDLTVLRDMLQTS